MTEDMEPAPETLPSPEAQPDKAPSRFWLTLVGASALLLGAHGFFTMQDDTSPQAAPAEVPAEMAARLEAGLSGRTLHLLPVDLSTPLAQEEAVKAMPVPEAQARALITDALAGRRNLGRVVVWDNVDQDNDVISVSSGGLSTTLTLRSVPQTVILPYPKGGSLAVSGVQDGGGGITVGLELSTGPLPLPPLRVGEVRVLPLF